MRKTRSKMVMMQKATPPIAAPAMTGVCDLRTPDAMTGLEVGGYDKVESESVAVDFNRLELNTDVEGSASGMKIWFPHGEIPYGPISTAAGQPLSFTEGSSNPFSNSALIFHEPLEGSMSLVPSV